MSSLNQPLHDRVLIRQKEGAEKSESGLLHIPEQARERPVEGVVVAVGGGKILQSGQRVPLDVRPGDTVLFGQFSGTKVPVDGEQLLIMREDEVLMIVSRAQEEEREIPF